MTTSQTFDVFDVIVVGSLNMDLVVRVPRWPQPGETLTGQSFATFLGGKGYNQALAARRAGSQVAFVGKLGRDAFGDQFEAALQQDGLDYRYISRTDEASTGVANIIVEPNGLNSIMLVPGTNGLLSASDVVAAASVFEGAKVLLLQLETPLDTAITAARLARAAGATVILTPAPAPAIPLPTELLQLIDILVPNEIEVFQLAGLPRPAASGESSFPERVAANSLLQQGVKAVLVTLGGRGALLVTPDKTAHFPGYQVEVVDTTAAGDAFTGTLATGLAHGLSIEEAIKPANAAGALACTRPGSGASLPTAAQVQAFLASQHQILESNG